MLSEWTHIRKDERRETPKRAHAHDIGYDLTVSRDTVIEPYAFAAIPTNIAIALPAGVFALLTARSSLFYRKGLIAHTGTIDPGYRGELLMLVYNPRKEPSVVKAGERLFQLVPLAQMDLEWQHLAKGKDLPVSDRGVAGFGSSGGY